MGRVGGGLACLRIERRRIVRSGSRSSSCLTSPSGHGGAQAGVGGEDAVVALAVHARRGNQSGEGALTPRDSRRVGTPVEEFEG